MRLKIPVSAVQLRPSAPNNIKMLDYNGLALVSFLLSCCPRFVPTFFCADPFRTALAPPAGPLRLCTWPPLARPLPWVSPTTNTGSARTPGGLMGLGLDRGWGLLVVDG